MILHIPHSSIQIPQEYLSSYRNLTQNDFNLLTDWYTEELYRFDSSNTIIYPYSRIFCDVERFRNDELEYMNKFGMGVTYTKGVSGNIIRDLSDKQSEEIKKKYYDPHHQILNLAVEEELKDNGKCMIVDCHSFPDELVPFMESAVRPDFCLGSDNFHTPKELLTNIKNYLISNGYCVEINEPFSGSMVSSQHYKKNRNVNSILIEVNRKLYLDNNYNKNSHYNDIKDVIFNCIKLVESYTKNLK